MSEVAGRMSIQIGASYLQENNNGRGILLGGVPGVPPATVLIIGAGVVGTQAALMASGLDAKVYLLDTNLERLQHLSKILPKNVTTLISNSQNIRLLAREADLLIGGVLTPGAKAPKLITKDILRSMKARSVIIDVAIDQGGSLETSHPTSHDNPVYLEENILHYCVTNIPAAVPVTSTPALNNASFPYLELIANLGWKNALQSSSSLAKGLNILNGKIMHSAVAEAFSLPWTNF